MTTQEKYEVSRVTRSRDHASLRKLILDLVNLVALNRALLVLSWVLQKRREYHKKKGYSLRYYHANREKCLKANSEWQKENKNRRIESRRCRESRPEVREKILMSRKNSYSKNRTQRLLANSAWRQRNKERRKEYHKNYYAKNRDKKLASHRKWKQRPENKIAVYMRTRVYHVLTLNRGVKRSDATFRLVGCSPKELKSHLENQFKLEMSWDNYGTYWEVDHRRPCASFDLLDETQQRECFHFSNLQPLTKTENRQKHAKENYESTA